MQNKMQHVLKREPCYKCQLPVFLAERQVHGSRLYHRTCLRCARCQSQLTPGSYYETEQDGEFCCETCPDEDATTNVSANDRTDSAALPDEARQSFSNKLALFQMRAAGTAAAEVERGKGLLNKSLSDEEKSQSLKRLTALYSMHSADGELVGNYKSGLVRSSFLTTQLTEDENVDPHLVEESEEDDEEEDEEGSDEADDDEPPSLPTVEPPLSHTEPIPDVVPIQTTLPSKALLKPPLPVKPSVIVIPSQNTPMKMPSALSTQPDETVEQSELARETKQEISIPVQTDNDLKDETTSLSKDVPGEIQAVGDRLSLVLARLKQFEDHPDNTNHKDKFSSSASSSHHHSFDDPVVPVAEIVSLEVVDSGKDSIVKETNEGHHPMKDELDHLQKMAMRQAVNEINEEVEQLELDKAQPDVNEVLPEEVVVVPTPRKRQSKVAREETKPTAMARTTMNGKATPNVVENPQNAADNPLTGNQIHPDASETPPNVTETTNQLITSYPIASNPFGDDEDDIEPLEQLKPIVTNNSSKRNSFNPFDSSDDEVELDKLASLKPKAQPAKRFVQPSSNPFGSESDDDDNEPEETSKRMPIPTPRKTILDHSSLQSTPELTPRPSRTSASCHTTPKTYDQDSTAPSPMLRNQQMYGSVSSLTSISSSLNTYTRRHKSRAPLPPTSSASKLSAVTSPSQPSSLSPCTSVRNSPSASARNTPTMSRKKRLAPPPPPPSASKPITNMPEEHRLETIPSEDSITSRRAETPPPDYQLDPPRPNHVRKLIPVDRSLIETPTSNEATDDVVYRRTIMPLDTIPTPTADTQHDRQWQKVKENKESLNKNRQSQCSTISSPDSSDAPAAQAHTEAQLYSNKSTYGKWKRRKGPAPALPTLTASSMMMATSSSSHHRALQMMPLQDIRYELEVIEVQQQGLEKQGIQLEKMIRERCEGGAVVMPIEELANTPNTKEVEDLILQLFEIVNEKNDLFRRQAELMYIRRLHRLEQEQAQIEFEIRMLMAQPESNKTDSDKAREDSLIARKVEIVLQRNEVIDCLDADRLREAEEDQTIKRRLELHNAKRDEEPPAPIKLSKKEKKKLSETKKLAKQKKMDADKDADESELKAATDDASTKKKKRKFLAF